MRASIASCVACPLPSIPALRSFRAASVCRYLRLHRAAKASPSPAAMHFFQIEFADGLSGDCEVIAGGKIVPELEGLSGGSHPADFLRIMSDGARPLHVIYSRPSNTGSFVLQIVSGSVTVVFDFEFPDEIVSDLAALDEAAYLRQCDRFALLDSIYAFRKPDGPVRSDAKFAVTAAAYLAAMT